MTPEQAVEEYQCPGCVVGCNTQCGKYAVASSSSACTSHVAGTFSMGSGSFYLGMPKGFNKVGPIDFRNWATKNNVRLYLTPDMHEGWNHLNIAVWAMEHDGALFVRTFCPRIGVHYVDVIIGGKMDLVPNAVNVAEFIDEID